jgi:hypothetical protein
MKKIAILPIYTGIILLCVNITQSVAQKFIVTEAHDSKYENGQIITVGDALQVDTQINIMKGGSISIQHPNWYKTYFTKAGTYRMDNYLDKIKESSSYIKHDSLYNFYRSYGMDSCIFASKTYAVRRLSRTDAEKMMESQKQDPYRIMMNVNSPTSTNQSTVKLGWNIRGGYRGNYFIIINNMFNDYLDKVIVTKRNKITLDLNKYGNEKVILVRIYSENCTKVTHLIKR